MAPRSAYQLWGWRALAVAFMLLGLSAPSIAGTSITVMTSGGFTAAYTVLAKAYELKSGNTLVTIRGPSMGADPTAIPARLARGEKADAVIMVRSALDQLIAKGEVGNATNLGLGHIAMAVKARAPRPDIRTVAAFKRTLLAAKSIAYSDSASGVYLSTVLFNRLGIAKQMAAKSHMIQATPVGLNIARGEYELGFQQLSELKPVPGIDIVGLIPDAVQQVTPFAAAPVTAAPNLPGARDLIHYLASPAAFAAIRASGLVPAQDHVGSRSTR